MTFSILMIAEFHWLLITFNMMGKMFNAASYAAIYLFAAELFPTVIRHGGMGVSSVCARIGGISSDYVILLVSFVKAFVTTKMFFNIWFVMLRLRVNIGNRFRTWFLVEYRWPLVFSLFCYPRRMEKDYLKACKMGKLLERKL